MENETTEYLETEEALATTDTEEVTKENPERGTLALALGIGVVAGLLIRPVCTGVARAAGWVKAKREARKEHPDAVDVEVTEVEEEEEAETDSES